MSGESSVTSNRKLVLPGDLIETKSKPGKGIFRSEGRVHSSVVGYSSDKSGYINVNAITGRYNPKVGDKIIAVCAETGPSIWRMNIGSSFNSTLHHSESGWKVPFGDTARFLSIGDAIWAEVSMVDASGSHQISLKKDDCRKLYSGNIVKINPTNVPRIIGKQGSMISLIRDNTKTRIWKYLQLLLFSLVSEIPDSNTFGDTAKLFEAIDTDEFKTKLEETISNMETCFDMSNNGFSDMSFNRDGHLPDPTKLHDDLNKMMDGKLGNLAREIAEETELNAAVCSPVL